jgi:nitrate/nitrite transporter NarK
VKHLLDSLKSGNWRALLACFLYFDTGFTVWVMFGPLAPFIHKDIAMSPAELGFLVAVPVLGAAILRVTLGNLYQAYDGRRIALLGVALSATTISCPIVIADAAVLRDAAGARRISRRGRCQFCRRPADGRQ